MFTFAAPPSRLLILLANVSFMSRRSAGDIIASAPPQVPDGQERRGGGWHKTQLVRSIWLLVKEAQERSQVVFIKPCFSVTLKTKCCNNNGTAWIVLWTSTLQNDSE